jgi:toxin-antitoxin system PIN domain toxin
VIAVDTNILVYAHREDSEWHGVASSRLATLAEGRAAWAIAWPCIHEFLAIVTHPRIFAPPSPLPAALDQVDAWLESPTLILLTESSEHWAVLRSLISKGKVAGPRIHDARIAALCAQHGVGELWSADRDFTQFRAIRVVNPLVR